MPENETIVDIPGQVYAVYRDGRIVKVVFTPHASAAGYFGPAATVDEGDEDLDVESTDGPFWKAMQKFMAGGEGRLPRICWEE